MEKEEMLGSLKVRRDALIKFLEENEGKDLTNLDDIKMLEVESVS